MNDYIFKKTFLRLNWVNSLDASTITLIVGIWKMVMQYTSQSLPFCLHTRRYCFVVHWALRALFCLCMYLLIFISSRYQFRLDLVDGALIH